MNLSGREIEKAKFTFSIYDFDGKNVIDAFNLGDALRALGLNPTLNAIEKLGGTKRKREKMLQVEEFLSIYAQAKDDKDFGCPEDFMECLKSFDKKGEGKMSAAELNHILLSYGEKLDSDESEIILRDCADSPDEEGLISYKMFLNRLVGESSTSTLPMEKSNNETVVKTKTSKKGKSDAEASTSTPEESAPAKKVKAKSPKPRSGSITTSTEPKPAPKPVEKKFQMPLISMKTDALFK